MLTNWLQTQQSRKNDTETYTGRKLSPGKNADSQLTKADISSSIKREKSGCRCSDGKGGATELPDNAETGTISRDRVLVDCSA